LALGKSIRECQETIDFEEFKTWIAYYKIQPYDGTRVDLLIAQLTALTANIHKRPGVSWAKPIDFMPWERQSQKRKMSGEQMKKTFEIFAKMHNKRLQKGG